MIDVCANTIPYTRYKFGFVCIFKWRSELDRVYMCAGTGKGQIGQRWKLLTNIEKYGQRWTIMDKYERVKCTNVKLHSIPVHNVPVVN